MKKIVKKLETALYVCASVSLIIYYFFSILDISKVGNHRI